MTSPNMTFVVQFVFVFVFISSINAQQDSASVLPAKSFEPFIPQDNILIDAGASSPTTLPGGRVFQPDGFAKKYLSYEGIEVVASVSGDKNKNLLPIYLNAKIFENDATYTFPVSNPGWHWVRLHFYPLITNNYDLKTLKFTVDTDTLVLLRDFQADNDTAPILKEFLVNVTAQHFPLTFRPSEGTAAFINAIEFVSAPNPLITNSVPLLFPVSQPFDLSSSSLETVYRLNAGGPRIEPQGDTLGRTWSPDSQYLDPKQMGKNVSVSTTIISYPKGGGSPVIAPPSVYASAVEMADSKVSRPDFNVTWKMPVQADYSYLLRLHFCDIVSKSLNQLYFNVYINDKMAVSGLDLSTLTGQLDTAFYKDLVVNSSMISDPLLVKVSPVDDAQGMRNAILNGLEVFKLNNSVGSFDGVYGVDGSQAYGGGTTRRTVAALGFAMMFGAFIGLGAMAVKWQKRPQDWQKSKSFSSWLLPIHAGDTTFMSKGSLGSRKSQFFSSRKGLGMYFSLAELQEATNNWDKEKIIGVGGFGNVYVGVISDGTQVAVKRGNPQSEQGINEFQTEIQMLSKLRHRHLVSLIGYCEENAEMILVYEFMANGPLRDHLYGKNMPSLSWKQRLEICIGAARGLHYLHTGAAQGIIHRDVKSTNILLDDNFIAKMADFGLSKDAPTTEGQTHVSTAVKGSFGYLDPEYFRKQQLTDKSDVYSFGVVLFEVLCARPAIDPQLPREQVNLAEWAMQWKRKGLLDKIIDPKLVGDINPESMKKFAEAAEKCLAEYGVDRPTMGDVLWNLESALQIQESSLQAKAEEENRAFSTPSPASAPPAAENQQTVESQEGNNEHSGTALFVQFTDLNGR